MTVFANRAAGDTLRFAFPELARGAATVRLAAPFFSYSEPVESLAAVASVYLIVRLGPATSPDALGRVLKHPDVQVRFFTSSLFHSKLYVFGSTCAVVGSANLTDAGMQSNREACVTVPGLSDDFEDLSSLFERYWADATVLNDQRLAEYRAICHEHPRAHRDGDLEKAVVRAFGSTVPGGGIQDTEDRPSADRLFLADYERTYQGFEAAFFELARLYQDAGIRRTPALPLRIEIDQFVNYVRDYHCVGEAYSEAPLRDSAGRESMTRSLIEAWRNASWPYMHEHIEPNYVFINQRLGSSQAIQAATPEELADALEVCHSFKTRLRYFPGGLASLRQAFLGQSHDRIRRSFIHLLHGDLPYIERMADLIFDPHYKLQECGRSVVQELLGWVNREDVPICNLRTLKILRYIGHDVVAD